MEFTLNPCSACWKKYKSGNCNINEINSCVAETAAAFTGYPSNSLVSGTDAGKNWQQCMETMMKAEGRTPCDFQLEMAPVWNQYPHYFYPELLNTKNANKAEQNCILRCSKLRNNKKPCIENCKTDRDAVQEVEKYEKAKPKITKKSDNDNGNNDDDDGARKEYPVTFWISFSITAILLAFVLTIFYRTLVSN